MGPGSLHAHWTWLSAAVQFGWPFGTLAGVALAMVWRGQDKRSGKRIEKPIKVGKLAARRLQAKRFSDKARGTVVVGVDRRRKAFALGLDELNVHTLVLGATGAGKTTALIVLVEAALRDGLPVAFVDLKGDPQLARRMGALSAKHRRRFRHWSIDGPAHYNPLVHGGPSELKDKLIGMESWSEPHYKRAAERHLQTIFTVLIELGETATLARVVELLDVGRLKQIVRELPEHRHDALWGYLDALNRDHLSAIAGLQNRLALITESQAGGWLIDPEGGGIDLAQSLTGGEVVLFSLNSSVYGETAAQLGGLITQDLKTAAGRRIDEDLRGQALVVIDEFSALDGDHVLGLLARGRSAGVGVVLATQELADLARVDDGFVDQVLGNTATKLVMRQEVPGSAETLAQVAGTRQMWEPTRQVDDWAVLQRRTGMGSERLVDVFAVHPNEIKGLACGEMFVIRNAGGRRADRVRVVPLPFTGEGNR